MLVRKRKIICLLFLSTLFLSFDISFHCSSAYSRSLLLRDAENEFCPVTGNRITIRRFNTGYKGKRYWFSSYSAVREFKTDPEKYLKQLETFEKTGGTKRTGAYF